MLFVPLEERLHDFVDLGKRDMVRNHNYIPYPRAEQFDLELAISVRRGGLLDRIFWNFLADSFNVFAFFLLLIA